MIKNEREYRITHSQAEQFEKAVASLKDSPSADGVDPKIRAIEAAALRSQLDDLRCELREYESLKAGERDSLAVDTLDELPRALIQGRIATGMSQGQLGEHLGVSKQMIQRYEASNYASASLTRLKEVARALGVYFRGEASVPTKLPTVAAIFKRLSSAGVDRHFVLDRVLPSPLSAELEEVDAEPDRGLVLQMLNKINEVFGWSPMEIFGTSVLAYDDAALSAGFKLPKNAAPTRTHAYAVYAYRLASITLKATAHLESHPIPTESKLVRNALLDRYGAVDFEPALRWAWSLGVPVLPLRDSIAFYGACWRQQGRNVVVLKQPSGHVARWLADLLHELYHAAFAPELPERRVLELEPLERRGDDEEDFANDFASDVVLDDRADALAVKCVEEADAAQARVGGRHGNMPFLKQAVRTVAAAQSLPVDSLANYLAFRLKLQDPRMDWWGTAGNLQRTDPDPWQIARDIFFEHARLEVLTEAERELVTRALTEVESR